MSEDASCPDDDFKGLLPLDYVSAPATDDVARCNDGLFSNNTDFAATCSSAGGVAEWLATFGECTDGTVIKMSEDASCPDDDFKGLLPPDYVPVTTTTVPPTTAPPLTLAEQLKAAIDDELNSGDLRSVDIAATRVVITIRSADGLTDGGTKDAGRRAVASALEAAQVVGLPPEITSVSVVILFDLVDQFGQVTESTVVEADYTTTTINKIVFDNIDETKILLLADAYLYVHPAFAKDDGS